MREIPGHPFDLGEDWNQALAGNMPNWEQVFGGYIAAVDWPASMFWHELSAAYPNALVILSVRDSAETWWGSMNETVLPVARKALASDWNEGRGLLELIEQFAGTKHWDDPTTLISAYQRHNTTVRNSIPDDRLVEWNASEGWEPLCIALNLPISDLPFPWTNKRSDWS
jgi:hypothetical protein